MAEKVIAILTNFQDFNPGYSLSGIVVSQIHMLLRAKHKVHLFVNEQFNPGSNDDAGITKLQDMFLGELTIHKKTKFMHLIDYKTEKTASEDHKLAAKEAGTTYAEEFIKLGITSVYTHDFIFVGWNYPYSLAIKEANKQLESKGHNLNWYHWVHSMPSGNRDWWDIDKYGPNHFVVFPNRTEIMRVSEQFKTNPSRIRIIPHIVDIRNWYDFDLDAYYFCNEYPKMLSADVIQVYPCSTDRMSAKQLDIVIKIFAFMKNTGNVPVFLVVANQWATTKQPKESVKNMIELAKKYGLDYGEDIVFTSEFAERFETGISKKMLSQLQLISNLFVFPTREESFGLVGPEVAMSGALVVANKSLDMMTEVLGTMTPQADFGSFHNNVPDAQNDDYLRNNAMAILNRLYLNEAIMTKNHCRKTYNMDNLYYRYYLPMTL